MKGFKTFQIFVLIPFLTSESAPMLPNTLDLIEPLSHFSTCTITIITAKIRENYNNFHQNTDPFYQVGYLNYLPVVRFMVEYHKRDILPTGNICDNEALYTTIEEPLPINNEATFPFSKYGCNVLVYISLPQCKQRWDHNSILPRSAYEFIPKRLKSLITGKLESWPINTFPSILTKNPKIIIIVQKQNMDIPEDALFKLDYVAEHNSDFRNEYQSIKLVFEVKSHPSDHYKSNILKVSSIIIITDWNFDNFNTQLEIKCGPNSFVVHPCYQNFKLNYSCKRNSKFCVANYETFKSVPQALATLETKVKNSNDIIKWIIFGTSANQILDKVEGNTFPNLNKYSTYLTDCSNGYYDVDVLLLSILYPNSTKYIGERLVEYSNAGDYTYPTIQINVAVDALFGFRLKIKGIHYVTCASGLGKKWLLSFSGFISIYEIGAWAALLSFGLCTGLLFMVAMEKRTTRSSRRRSASDLVWYGMFSLVVLLEQGFTFPKKSAVRLPKCIVRMNHLIPLYICWILVGIVLSNGYRGANIDKLIAIIPDKRFETFEQIMERNFTVFGEFWESAKSFAVSNPYMRNYSLVSPPGYLDILQRNNRLFNYVCLKSQTCDFDQDLETQDAQDYFELVNPSQQYRKAVNFIIGYVKIPQIWYDLEISNSPNYFLKKLTACDNEAFVGNYNQVFRMYSKLKEHLRNNDSGKIRLLSISKESLLPAYKTNLFSNIPAEWRASFTKRLLILKESGLEDLWINWFEFWGKWNETVEAGKERVNIRSLNLVDSNVRVVFILLGFIIIPSAIFCGEIIYNRRLWCLMILPIQQIVNLIKYLNVKINLKKV